MLHELSNMIATFTLLLVIVLELNKLYSVISERRTVYPILKGRVCSFCWTKKLSRIS